MDFLNRLQKDLAKEKLQAEQNLYRELNIWHGKMLDPM